MRRTGSCGRRRLTALRAPRRGKKGVGRTEEVWGTSWATWEDYRRLVLAGTKEEPRRPRRTEANSGEMSLLRWARRDEEGLGT